MPRKCDNLIFLNYSLLYIIPAEIENVITSCYALNCVPSATPQFIS